MPWYVIVFIVYIILDRCATLWYAGQGKAVKITGATAILSLITGSLIIWMVLSLVGAC